MVKEHKRKKERKGKERKKCIDMNKFCEVKDLAMTLKLEFVQISFM